MRSLSRITRWCIRSGISSLSPTDKALYLYFPRLCFTVSLHVQPPRRAYRRGCACGGLSVLLSIYTGYMMTSSKWKYFPRYWPFVRGIHRSPPHKGQWRGALMFFFDMCLYKRLSKQSQGWWFETPFRPLWRHCNDKQIKHMSAIVSEISGNAIIGSMVYLNWQQGQFKSSALQPLCGVGGVGGGGEILSREASGVESVFM